MEEEELPQEPAKEGLAERYPQWKIWAMACGLAVALFAVCAVVTLNVMNVGAPTGEEATDAQAGTLEQQDAARTETPEEDASASAVGAVGGAVTDSEHAAAEADAQAAGVDYVETESQRNAFMSAKLHMSEMPYSHAGIISVLESEGYSHEDAVYAADRLGVDWNAKAAEMAQQYVDTMEFTREDLLDQLMYEGFTAQEAAAGVAAIGM